MPSNHLMAGIKTRCANQFSCILKNVTANKTVISKNQGTLALAMGWILFPPNLYVEVFTCNVIFGDEAFWKVTRVRWAHEGGSSWWDSYPHEKKNTPKSLLTLHKSTKKRSCEHAVRWWLLSLKGKSLTNWQCWKPEFELPGSRTVKKQISAVQATQSCSILLWQPQLTNTVLHWGKIKRILWEVYLLWYISAFSCWVIYKGLGNL